MTDSETEKLAEAVAGRLESRLSVLEEIRAKVDRLASEPTFRPGYLKGDRQAAHYCGMKRDAFRKWVEKERVPYKVIAGHRYFKLTILDRRMTPPEARREEGYLR